MCKSSYVLLNFTLKKKKANIVTHILEMKK